MAAPQIESIAEAKSGGSHEAGVWLKRIHRALEEESQWRKDALESLEVFEAAEDANVTFNVWHSNLETVRPTLYNSTAIPDVRRRYDDGDQVAKDVVDLTERSITYCVDTYDIDAAFKAIIKDAVVTGRGVGRVRYKALFDDADLVSHEQVTFERVKWDRFIRGPGINWDDVTWIAFEHRLTREELKKLNKKLGKELGVGDTRNETRGRHHNTQKDDPDKGIFFTAKVYEIWDKEARQVSWVAEDEPRKWLKKPDDDPLGLSGFFPILKPLQPAFRLSSLTPLVPYNVIKPLLQELDKVSKRINRIITVLKVRGIVASEIEQDMELLKDAEDGEFIYAKSSTSFAQGAGGLDNAIHYWPVDKIIPVLIGLREHRAQLLQEIDQVSGISDILRGQTDPRETLGAQNIKAQFGGVRIQDWQNDVAALARDLFRAKVELFAGKFADETLMAMTGLPQEQDQEQVARFPQVMQMFRSDMRTFRIDIETDSTVRSDLTRSQEMFTQFLSGTAQFASAIGGLVQIAPQVIPTAIEVYTAFARKFKLGKQAEDSLDQLSQLGQQVAEQAEQVQQSDPAADLARAELEQKAQMFQLETSQAQERHQQELSQKSELHQLELTSKQQDHELEMQIEAGVAQLKIDVDRATANQDLETKSASAKQELTVKRQTNKIDVAKSAAEQGLPPPVDFDDEQRSQALDGMTQAIQTMAEAADAMRASVEAATAPRQINIERDGQGNIVGGTSTPDTRLN